MSRQLELFAPSEIALDAAVVASRQKGRVVKRALMAFYSDESNFNFTKEGEETVFPDGKPWFACWAWGDYVRRLHGRRAWLYGFDADENPLSSVARDCGGHHFALLDRRFIVDGWLANVEGFHASAAFDLVGAADARTIRHFYGPPEVWLEKFRMRDREQQVDQESVEERAKALRGVAAVPEVPILPHLAPRIGSGLERWMRDAQN